MTLSSVISFLAIVGCVLAVDSDLNLCYHVERLLKSGVDPNQVVAALKASSKVPVGLFRNLAGQLQRQNDPALYDSGVFDIVTYKVKTKNGKNSATNLQNMVGVSGSTISAEAIQLKIQADSVYKNSNVAENATVMEMISPATANFKKSPIKNRNNQQSKSASLIANRSNESICDEMLTRGISKDKLVFELLKTITYRHSKTKPSSSFQRSNVTRKDSKKKKYIHEPGDITIVTDTKNGKESLYSDMFATTNGVAQVAIQNIDFGIQSHNYEKKSATANIATVTTTTTNSAPNIPNF